jgi:hypothetical protein
MTDDRLRSYGVFLLRVALGAMFIAHSTIYMLMTLTPAGTAKSHRSGSALDHVFLHAGPMSFYMRVTKGGTHHRVR